MAKTFLFFVLFAASVGLSLWGLQKQGFFNLEKIEVVLDSTATPSRFLEPSVTDLNEQVQGLKGQSLFDISLKPLSDKLSQFAWVEQFQIRRHWPDRLEIWIQPKVVKYLFIGKDGRVFPVLADGTFMSSTSTEHLPDVVLLRGDEFVKNKELLSRALKLIDEVPLTGTFSRQTISEIRFDPKEGFWATMMKAGTHVKLGDSAVNLKADRVGQVLDYLETHQLDARVIDANLTKKVLVRLRKRP